LSIFPTNLGWFGLLGRDSRLITVLAGHISEANVRRAASELTDLKLDGREIGDKKLESRAASPDRAATAWVNGSTLTTYCSIVRVDPIFKCECSKPYGEFATERRSVTVVWPKRRDIRALHAPWGAS